MKWIFKWLKGGLIVEKKVLTMHVQVIHFTKELHQTCKIRNRTSIFDWISAFPPITKSSRRWWIFTLHKSKEKFFPQKSQRGFLIEFFSAHTKKQFLKKNVLNSVIWKSVSDNVPNTSQSEMHFLRFKHAYQAISIVAIHQHLLCDS